jgi:hypothetical protein
MRVVTKPKPTVLQQIIDAITATALDNKVVDYIVVTKHEMRELENALLRMARVQVGATSTALRNIDGRNRLTSVFVQDIPIFEEGV